MHAIPDSQCIETRGSQNWNLRIALCAFMIDQTSYIFHNDVLGPEKDEVVKSVTWWQHDLLYGDFNIQFEHSTQCTTCTH